MRFKRPYAAALDQVKIGRQGAYGIIEYVEPNVYTTHLRIGPEVQQMTDQQILDRHNECLRVQQEMAASYEHVAIEVPVGRPQITYWERCGQWTPRGDVLRCVIGDGGPNGEAEVYVDDQELSLREFGQLLTTYTGWGMRIVFVPEDEISEEPEIVVREPDEKDLQ